MRQYKSQDKWNWGKVKIPFRDKAFQNANINLNQNILI